MNITVSYDYRLTAKSIDCSWCIVHLSHVLNINAQRVVNHLFVLGAGKQEYLDLLIDRERKVN